MVLAYPSFFIEILTKYITIPTSKYVCVADSFP